MESPKKPITPEIALQKLQSYCAYQERCHFEISQKLQEYAIFGERADAIMARLIQDNFLNEERYAVSYARGKFRIKSWGKIKIRQGLKAHFVPEYAIKKAIQGIDNEGTYMETLKILLIKKIAFYDGDTQKAAQSALRRGFESALVFEMLSKVENS